jgi:hypothetical protein
MVLGYSWSTIFFLCRVAEAPSVSSAQRKYEKDRFKVEPGRIQDYSLGRGSLANQERNKVSTNITRPDSVAPG